MLASHITEHRLRSIFNELEEQIATDGGVTLSTISKISVSGRTLTISTTDGREHSAPLPDGITREEFTTELEGVMGRKEYERDRNGIVTSLALKADAAWVRQIIENLPQQTGTQGPVDSILSLSTEGNDLVLTLTSGKVHKVTLPQPEVNGEFVTLDQLSIFAEKLEEAATKAYVDQAVSAAVLEDTGWIDITSSAPEPQDMSDENASGIQAGQMLVRRVGMTVFLRVIGVTQVNADDGGGVEFGILPRGFRPDYNYAPFVPMFPANPGGFSTLRVEGGRLMMTTSKSGEAYSAYISFPVDLGPLNEEWDSGELDSDAIEV